MPLDSNRRLRDEDRGSRGERGDGGRGSCDGGTDDIAAALLADARAALEGALRADPNLVLEAKTWLIEVIAGLPDVSASTAAACFVAARRDAPPPLPRAAERQLLLLALEARPRALAALLSASPSLLRAFFAGAERGAVAAAWFGGFSPAGPQQSKRGARALALFALARRDTAWRHLVWAGAHPQAPVAVVTRPHYWLELDVPATVRALARGCPDFFESEELKACLEDGEWLALDAPFLARVRGQARAESFAVAAICTVIVCRPWLFP